MKTVSEIEKLFFEVLFHLMKRKTNCENIII